METLKIGNSTRWTILHSMIESFYHHQSLVDKELCDVGQRTLMLTETDFKCMEDMLGVLKRFKTGTKSMGLHMAT